MSTLQGLQSTPCKKEEVEKKLNQVVCPVMTKHLDRMHCHYSPSLCVCWSASPQPPPNKSQVQNHKEGVSHVWFVGREEESSECVTATEE